MQLPPVTGAVPAFGDDSNFSGERKCYRREASSPNSPISSYLRSSDSLFAFGASAASGGVSLANSSFRNAIQEVDDWLDRIRADERVEEDAARLPAIGGALEFTDQGERKGYRRKAGKPGSANDPARDVDSLGAGGEEEDAAAGWKGTVEEMKQVDEWFAALSREDRSPRKNHMRKIEAIDFGAAGASLAQHEDGPGPRSACSLDLEPDDESADSLHRLRAERRSRLAGQASAEARPQGRLAPLTKEAPLVVQPPSAPRPARPRPKVGEAAQQPEKRLPWNASRLAPETPSGSELLDLDEQFAAALCPMPPPEPRRGRAAPRRQLGHAGLVVISSGGSGRVAAEQGSDGGSYHSDGSSFKTLLEARSDSSQCPKAFQVPQAPASCSSSGASSSKPAVGLVPDDLLVESFQD